MSGLLDFSELLPLLDMKAIILKFCLVPTHYSAYKRTCNQYIVFNMIITCVIPAFVLGVYGVYGVYV